MATRREVSKIKAEFIAEREKLIRENMAEEQLKLYDELVNKYLQGPINVKDARDIIQQIEQTIQQFSSDVNSSILNQYTTAANTLTDLNMSYFSTMIDDKKKLNEIKQKTKDNLNKRLGIDGDGNLVRKGFIDRMIGDQAIQKKVIKVVKNGVASNMDYVTLQKNLKKIIVGSPDESGVFEAHYNTFAKDILNNIDRNNGAIYANQLGLQHFYYGGGLIKTSREFCIKNNGKIFSRQKAEGWKDQLNEKGGPIWNENIDGTYDPIEQMGGYGCLHSPDWITADLAKGNMREQNKIATQRNQNFKNRNGI